MARKPTDKQLFKMKNEWLGQFYEEVKPRDFYRAVFPEVSPHEFYRDLFPEGSLQSAEHDGKGNLIATQIRPSGKGRTKQWVVDDSLNMLDKVVCKRVYEVERILLN